MGQLDEARVLGQTLEGRNLWLVEKSNENANKTIFVDCGRSARDWVSISFCLDLVARTCEGSELQTINWLIMPLANPDGYEFTQSNDRQWQKNRARPVQGQFCPGVDLSRNFPFQWAPTSENQCSTNYAGLFAASD